jgi:hypothetical protein
MAVVHNYVKLDAMVSVIARPRQNVRDQFGLGTAAISETNGPTPPPQSTGASSLALLPSKPHYPRFLAFPHNPRLH